VTELVLRRRETWRTRTDPVRGRRRALREEVGYWRDWLATGGGKYADEYAYRFDPDAEVADPALREALEQATADSVTILDVGAGPSSTVGRRFPGLTLSVVAVDPLADEYDRLLARAGLTPPVRTRRVDGERLVESFGADCFDFAYSRNALDHAVDPVLVIEQMVSVVRPAGRVVLRHVRNEGVRQAYVQLHQWNFDECDGDFVVWREGRMTNVTQLLAGRLDVSCRVERGDEADWIVCVLTKRAARPVS
jgi:SAM-dependent methyltransferase